MSIFFFFMKQVVVLWSREVYIETGYGITRIDRPPVWLLTHFWYFFLLYWLLVLFKIKRIYFRHQIDMNIIFKIHFGLLKVLTNKNMWLLDDFSFTHCSFLVHAQFFFPQLNNFSSIMSNNKTFQLVPKCGKKY